MEMPAEFRKAVAVAFGCCVDDVECLCEQLAGEFIEYLYERHGIDFDFDSNEPRGVVASRFSVSEEAESDAVTDSLRFVTSTDTVFDTTTGLTWQREVTHQRFAWQAAKEYAASLSFAGGGWRLPTKNELMSIVDNTQNNPSIDDKSFPGTPADWFWSSSPYASDGFYAWVVNFGGGNSGYGDVTLSNRVRCVR